MVPFFGQGLNCGLEDVRVLDVILRDEGVDGATALQPDSDSKDKVETVIDARLERALRRYSETRHEDLVAICDLAMAN
jgi:kynurenine 3-monooxygenase